MKVLRTPEDRFAALPDFGYPPRYARDHIPTIQGYPDGSTVTYHYDSAGNRTQVVRTRINHGPVANNDSVSTPYQTPLTFDPRANDTDADSDSLTITSVGGTGHGATT